MLNFILVVFIHIFSLARQHCLLSCNQQLVRVGGGGGGLTLFQYSISTKLRFIIHSDLAKSKRNMNKSDLVKRFKFEAGKDLKSILICMVL